MDHNVEKKHHEKIVRYLYLSMELQALWNTRTEVVPLVFGALHSIPEQTKKNFELLKLTNSPHAKINDFKNCHNFEETLELSSYS